MRNTITKVDELERSFFADLGAWHAYALPQLKEDYGSSIGLLVMDLSGEWLTNTATKLNINEDGKRLIFQTQVFRRITIWGYWNKNFRFRELVSRND